ncbi:MAG: nucleotidyl transferase AbiEii/AbiGii toxin family protein [Thermoplasmatota archaeon]|jgi:predicted nucleotidyltransferase component of viral defense system
MYFLVLCPSADTKDRTSLKKPYIEGWNSTQFSLYLDIPRLSIDIDLNYIGATHRNFMRATRPFIEQSIQALGEHLGYTVKEKDSSYILSRYDFKYTTVRNTKDHMKIETNYLDRLPIGEIHTKKFPSIFTDVPAFSVSTYSLEELTAQKIKACIERAEPRDIYDLSSLSKQSLNSGKTRKYVAVYYCMIEEGETIDAVKRIETFDLEKIRQTSLRKCYLLQQRNNNLLAHFIKNRRSFLNYFSKISPYLQIILLFFFD